jgi:hypothetical protein
LSFLAVNGKNFKSLKNVNYAGTSLSAHKLDIYLPPPLAKASWPVVLAIL